MYELNLIVFAMMVSTLKPVYVGRFCHSYILWTAFVDPVSSGLIGILPDSTAGLLRFMCMLTLIDVLVMDSALKPD